MQLRVGQQRLQPGVLGLEFLEPFGVISLHAAVLGQTGVPRSIQRYGTAGSRCAGPAPPKVDGGRASTSRGGLPAT